jgi:hypothetical protein
MRTLDIDWADLELAFRDATGAESWLDQESGEVLTLVRGFDDERDVKDKLKRFPGRFIKLVPLDKSFTHDALFAFTAHQKGALAKKLHEALHDGPGAIARAMAVLHDDKPALTSWARFEQAELVKRVEEFLAGHGLRAGSEPPAPDLFEGMAS